MPGERRLYTVGDGGNMNRISASTGVLAAGLILPLIPISPAAAQTDAIGSASVTVRAKAFDPKSTGATKTDNALLLRADAPYPNTWCTRKKRNSQKVAAVGVRLKKSSSRSHFFISYERLAQNYKSAARSAKSEKRAKKLLRMSARYGTWGRPSSPRYQACKRALSSGSGTSPGTSPGSTEPPVTAAPPLRVDLTGAVGLALTGGNSRSSAQGLTRDSASNLAVVTSGGQVRVAVTSGSAQVSNMFISPNGTVYLTGNFSGSSLGSCSLAQIPVGGGDVTCVDPSLRVRWSSPGSQSQNPPVQFDSAGSVYYLGDGNSGSTVLRRNAGGVIKDLVTDNVYVSDFLVQSDGSVFLTGTTSSTGASWLRKINPSGGLRTLMTGSNMNSTPLQWIKRFPDNNVYTSQMNTGIARYLTASDSMDTVFWLGNGGQFDYSSGAGIFIDGALRTTLSGKVYGIASGGQLTSYFPIPSAVSVTGLSRATIVQSAMNVLIVAGTNASGQNVLMLHDTSDGSSTQLIGPADELEIYHLNYSSATGKIMFDGLRFSDNSYVLGEVVVNTGEVRTTAALATKWQDFQTFG